MNCSLSYWVLFDKKVLFSHNQYVWRRTLWEMWGLPAKHSHIRMGFSHNPVLLMFLALCTESSALNQSMNNDHGQHSIKYLFPDPVRLRGVVFSTHWTLLSARTCPLISVGFDLNLRNEKDMQSLKWVEGESFCRGIPYVVCMMGGGAPPYHSQWW